MFNKSTRRLFWQACTPVTLQVSAVINHRAHRAHRAHRLLPLDKQKES